MINETCEHTVRRRIVSLDRKTKNDKVVNINISKGVNYDYILVLSLNDGNRLELRNVPIKRSMSLIGTLLSYCNDNTYDVVDMHNLLRCSVKTYESFDYCLSHEYSDSFISDVKFPELNISEYREEEKAFRESLYHRTYKILKFKHRVWSDYELKNETNRLIELEFNKFNQKKKDLYVDRCLNYIYSHDYNATFSGLESKKTIISFSNEKHGRFSYEHEVNDDLKVRISTNFCYGSASTFRVIITYKGIEILPYSIWVKYYYAEFSELLHYTRSYRVIRSNWDVCMNFIVDFVNSAIVNPDHFVREVVMQEVREMMEGIKQIYTLGKDYLNTIMKLDKVNENKYVGVRDIHHCNASEREDYSVYSNEMYLVYRIGKISGALRFLDSLKQVAVICDEVNVFIDEIAAMNVALYPELTEAIPPIEVDIKNLKRKLNRENRQLNVLKSKFEYLDNRLNKILSKYKYEDKEQRRQSFLKAHPAYEKLKIQIQNQNETINKIRREHNTRNKFLSELLRFKGLIEKYVELPQVA